jgi:DNA-binding XRE family transcriptional regulator
MHSMTSYLRSHRKKSGLSRRELADIVGFVNKMQIARHERLDSIPTLITALSYQAIFNVPVSELFPGLYESVANIVEERLGELEKSLHESSPKGHKAHVTARKIVWLNERRCPALTTDA